MAAEAFQPSKLRPLPNRKPPNLPAVALASPTEACFRTLEFGSGSRLQTQALAASELQGLEAGRASEPWGLEATSASELQGSKERPASEPQGSDARLAS